MYGSITLIPIVFYILLGKLLQVSNGEYRFPYLIGLIAAWLLTVMALASFHPVRSAVPTSWPPRALAIGLAYFAIELAFRPQVNANEYRPAYQAIKGLTLLGAFSSVGIAVLIFRKSVAMKAFWTLFGVAAVSWFGCRILTVAYSPHPFIDTFTIPTSAADYFLMGINPYAQKYVDIYKGFYPYPPVYPYWPGVLYAQSITRWALGDIRYAFVLADLATVWGLLRISRSLHLPSFIGGLAALAWLAFPVSLHVLENSWTDVLLVATGIWTLVFVQEGKWWCAGVILGYFCGCKQYTVFFGVLSILAIFFRSGFYPAIQAATGATLVFALLLVPFAIADFDALYESTFKMLMSIPLRPDALSIPAGFYRESGRQLGGGLMSAAYLIALLLGGFWLARARGSLRALGACLVLVYGAVFLMGKQAFCNYYYLLASFVLIAYLAQITSDKTSDERLLMTKRPSK